jgi:hypothetical protein
MSRIAQLISWAVILSGCLPPVSLSSVHGEADSPQCPAHYFCAVGLSSGAESQADAIRLAREDAVGQLGLVAFPTLVRQRWMMQRESELSTVTGQVESQSAGRLQGVEIVDTVVVQESLPTLTGVDYRWRARVRARISSAEVTRIRRIESESSRERSESIVARARTARAKLKSRPEECESVLLSFRQLSEEIGGGNQADLSPLATAEMSSLADEIAAYLELTIDEWEFESRGAFLKMLLRAGGRPARNIPLRVGGGRTDEIAREFRTDPEGMVRLPIKWPQSTLDVSILGEARFTRTFVVPKPWVCTFTHFDLDIEGWREVRNDLEQAIRRVFQRGGPERRECPEQTAKGRVLRVSASVQVGEPLRLGGRLLQVGAQVRMTYAAEVNGWVLERREMERPLSVGGVDSKGLEAALTRGLVAALEEMLAQTLIFE